MVILRNLKKTTLDREKYRFILELVVQDLLLDNKFKHKYSSAVYEMRLTHICCLASAAEKMMHLITGQSNNQSEWTQLWTFK